MTQVLIHIDEFHMGLFQNPSNHSSFGDKIRGALVARLLAFGG